MAKPATHCQPMIMCRPWLDWFLDLVYCWALTSSVGCHFLFHADLAPCTSPGLSEL